MSKNGSLLIPIDPYWSRLGRRLWEVRGCNGVVSFIQQGLSTWYVIRRCLSMDQLYGSKSGLQPRVARAVTMYYKLIFIEASSRWKAENQCGVSGVNLQRDFAHHWNCCHEAFAIATPSSLLVALPKNSCMNLKIVKGCLQWWLQSLNESNDLPSSSRRMSDPGDALLHINAVSFISNMNDDMLFSRINFKEENSWAIINNKYGITWSRLLPWSSFVPILTNNRERI